MTSEPFNHPVVKSEMTSGSLHPAVKLEITSEALHHSAVNSIFDVPEYRGLWSWVASIDHKQIGIMYIISAFFFFLVAVGLALLMKIQLALPMNHFISQDLYNQVFTMHGTTMIFLVAMPLLFGFSVYLTPLMIGARDMAYPRLNAMGFWIYFFGALLLYFSFLGGGAPAAGWFSYAPLTEKGFLSNPGVDYWALSLLVTGIGSVATGINLIATILTFRAPGMSLQRVPLFVWMVLSTSVLVVLSLPALNAAIVMIEFDRFLRTNFFQPEHGGSAILWQNYFWFFGHPEVYILILPGFGIVTEVIPVFSRKVLFGAGFMMASTVAITFLSFGVWMHHMFATGLGFTVLYIFALSSLLIAVPTGIKVWTWLATMWGGQLRFTTAMLFAMAFVIQFTIGGLSGVTFAIIPLDWQLTDSYFVVAHIHYVLLGGMFFAMLSGVYYWYPKVTGRMLSETMGKWHFWLMTLGFNGTFMVMHLLGIYGMPRRVWTYPFGQPAIAGMNLFSSLSAIVLAGSILLFFFNMIHSLYKGKIAGDNPWDAWTLEWMTTSPPHPENFETVPYIHSRRPLWDMKHGIEESKSGAH